MNTTREAALPLTDAPKDHTLLWLLVDYSGDGANPLEDEILGWTIGHNGFDHTGVDEWEFAGWSWEQDCFTQGVGNVVGWYPLQRPDQHTTTPATEPEYVAGQLEMERKVLAVMSDLLVASDLLNERWKARSKIVSARLFEHAATMQTIREALAARPAPQPAADTRLVTVALLTEAQDLAFTSIKRMRAGHVNCNDLTMHAEEYVGKLRAIIGTATPAQPDKIAEAARAALMVERIDDVSETCRTFNLSEPHFRAALRALVAK